jgi:hypothetical protein
VIERIVVYGARCEEIWRGGNIAFGFLLPKLRTQGIDMARSEPSTPGTYLSTQLSYSLTYLELVKPTRDEHDTGVHEDVKIRRGDNTSTGRR